jgi:hypothetical protein
MNWELDNNYDNLAFFIYNDVFEDKFTASTISNSISVN